MSAPVGLARLLRRFSTIHAPSTRQILIYTKAGTDANAAATFTASNVYTVPAGGHTVADVLLVNGSVAVAASDVNFAEVDINDVGGTLALMQTITSASGGTGNIAASETVSWAARVPIANSFPFTLTAGTQLSIVQSKGGTGVVLGPYTLYLVVR